jgi:membrane protein implicated in regulation of membrane protease activity
MLLVNANCERRADMGVLFWLAVMLLLLVIEACTLGLLTIWFAIGALVSAILSVFIPTVWIQWLVFTLVSAVFLAFIRPLLIDKVNLKKTKTNVEALAGKTARVVKEIDNFAGSGTVILNGMEWSALSADDKVIKEGTNVSVKQVRGVKLIVERMEEQHG